MEPHEFAARNREESEAWKKLFARLGVESLVYGFVIIQRRNGARQTFTVRRQASPGRRRAPWEWLLAWEGADKEGLLSSRDHFTAAATPSFKCGTGSKAAPGRRNGTRCEPSGRSAWNATLTPGWPT